MLLSVSLLGLALVCSSNPTEVPDAAEAAPLPAARRRVWVPPSVDFELAFQGGADFVLRSSRYALGESSPAEVGHGPAVAVAVGLSIPEAWVAVWISADAYSGRYRSRQVFAGTDAPELEAGSRFAVGLGFEVRPPWRGWAPYVRGSMGGTRLGTSDSTTPYCPEEDSLRCSDRAIPIDHINYWGVTGSAALGLAYQGLLPLHSLAAFTFEFRYTVSEWQSVKLKTAEGVDRVTLDVGGASRRLGDGPSGLHQVGILIGVRFGLVAWRERGSTPQAGAAGSINRTSPRPAY